MPRSARSLQVTDRYRARLAAIRARVQTSGLSEWPTIGALDSTRWPQRMAAVVAGAQAEATRASAGYLAAFLTVELQQPVRPFTIDSRAYAGVSRDGRPLEEALQSPIIGVLAALKDGRPADEALTVGLNRARRMLEVDVMHAARQSLLDTLDSDDRFDGWQRATAGTCGACMALAGTSGEHFDVHPGCQCVPAPVVRGVPNLVPLLTGIEMFRRMTRQEQDAQFGEEKAEALRAEEITLEDLVTRSRLVSDQRAFITEKPLEAAQ